MSEWERVIETRYSSTTRLAVPGGWIYRVLQEGVGVSLCFVPRPRTEEELVDELLGVKT